jgi:phage terminase small subunit
MQEPKDLIPADLLEELDPKRAKFVCARASGKNGKEAAIEAGYAPDHAKSTASRLMRDPRVSRAVEALQHQGAADAKYDLVKLIRKFEDCGTFAIKTKNAMALNKSLENIARLSGYLDPRIEVNITTVDVAEALAQAKARTARVIVDAAEDVHFTDVDHGDANR